ncbi:MAG: SDR family oxidoreductase [Planctomycetota bacterium]
MAHTYAILGATGGIGREIATRLAGAGHRLAIAAQTPDKLDALKAELGDAAVHAKPFDATQPGEVESFIAESAETLGSLDGIVNAVGSVIVKPAHLTSDDEFEKTLRLSLWTSFGVTRAAAKTMRKSGGSVVLFATAAARAGLPSHEAIAAAKGGVIGLTQSAAATYATNGIRFNCIAPGLVETPGTTQLTENETARKASEAMHPTGRIGTPADIAPAALWLLDPANTWTTGQVIGIDGGLGTLRGRVKM